MRNGAAGLRRRATDRGNWRCLLWRPWLDRSVTTLAHALASVPAQLYQGMEQPQLQLG